MSDLRCVIFDLDGTLLDSRALILHAMRAAFDAVGIDYPGDKTALSGVGLSMPVMMRHLLPDATVDARQSLIDAYREAFFSRRSALGAAETAPFFPGAKAVLEQLRAEDWTLMAIATGKSRRGLDSTLSGHGVDGWFQSTQTADEHPSKPHPSMIEAILRETGVAANRAVMVGDTSFDIDMAQAAGVAAIGVSWGHHTRDQLATEHVIDRFADLPLAIEDVIGAKA